MFGTFMRHNSYKRTRPLAAALLFMTHFMLAIAIALSALFGSYAGGDWTWWLSQTGVRKVR